MNTRLRPKQKKFADTYLETGNATEAAAQHYKVKSRAVARSIGSENLTKPDIMRYLAAHDKTAQNTIVEVMNNSSVLKDEPAHARVALDSAKDILDRLHGKATQRIEQHSTTVNLNLDLTKVTDTTDKN